MLLLCCPVSLKSKLIQVHVTSTVIIPVLFTVVGTCPAMSRLPVKLTELGSKTHLCHDMFTNLYYNVCAILLSDRAAHIYYFLYIYLIHLLMTIYAGKLVERWGR